MPTNTPEFAKETGSDGSFQRQTSVFRDWVTADGSSEFPAEAGRYHLYACAACPWAHRAIIVRELKGLHDAIGLTLVDPLRDEQGWRFGDGSPKTGDVDPLHGWTYLSEAYTASDPEFDARVTVPVIWDTKTNRIVNNESSEVIRMLNSAFDAFAAHPEVDLYPEALRPEIDAVNAWVYDLINNGVYKSGFAVSQEAYDTAFAGVFEGLDRVEELLQHRPYLAGEQLTEADWRLFTTLVRFDSVYVGHFKTNLRRIVDYPTTWEYTRRLYHHEGVAETVNFDHIKRHYYETHRQLNPSGIVPDGPAIDWSR